MEDWVRETGPLQVEIRVHAAPRAARTEVQGATERGLRIRLHAPPAEGRANEELVRFLARRLGVARRDVELRSGGTSRIQRVRVAGVTAHMVRARLAP